MERRARLLGKGDKTLAVEMFYVLEKRPSSFSLFDQVGCEPTQDFDCDEHEGRGQSRSKLRA